VPAAFHLQHPVKASSAGSCSIGAVPNPVISYKKTGGPVGAACSIIFLHLKTLAPIGLDVVRVLDLCLQPPSKIDPMCMTPRSTLTIQNPA